MTARTVQTMVERDPKKIARAIKLAQQREKAELLARAFVLLCVQCGLPKPIREYMFAAPERRWKCDFAWPEEKLLLENEGAAWSGGRHTIGSGYLADMEKYNAMTLRGWRLLRCTPQTLTKPETIDMLRAALTLTETDAK